MKNIKISNVKALQFFQLARYSALILIGILLSKSGISESAIGLYETFILIAGAFTFFWINGFLKAILPFSAEKSISKDLLVFNAFVLLSIFSVITAVLVYVLNEPFSSLLLNGNKVPLPYLLSGYILFNSPSLLTEYIYLINNKPKSILTYASILFTIQAVLIGILPFLGFGLTTIIQALFGISVLKFIWLIVVLSKHAKPELNKHILSKFLRYGWPLVLSTLLSSSARYIDGFIITSKFSPSDFAIFQYGARELPLAMLLANSLSMAMLPKLARADFKSPLAEFRSEVYRLNWLLFPISIALMVSSHWLFPRVFSPAFTESATIFNVYLLLVISRLLFPQTLLTAKKMNTTIVSASLFEIIINVSLSIILANYFGIIGVAYATFIAYIFEKVYLVFACKQKLGINPINYIPFGIYLLGSTLLIITFVLIEFIAY